MTHHLVARALRDLFAILLAFASLGFAESAHAAGGGQSADAAPAGDALVASETGAGVLRFAPSTPQDVYSYERLSAAWIPTSWLTVTGLGMVLRERLSGTASPPGTTWLFGGGAELHPTSGLALSAVSAGVPTSTGPDGSRRWLATGGVSASYDGLATGPFTTSVDLQVAYARLGFSAAAGPSPSLGQWSFGGVVTETIDPKTEVSLSATGFAYDGDTALLALSGAHFGAARGAGMAPYRFTVRPEIERTFALFSGRAYWEYADLVAGAGHELRAGGEVALETGTALSPVVGAEGAIRVTGSGAVPSGVVWVGARLAILGS